MEIVRTQVFRRESIETKWWHEYLPSVYPNHKNYVKEKYKDTNMLTTSITESDNKMMVAMVFTFSSPEAKAVWDSDEYMFNMGQNRAEYNDENNIFQIE
jgi:hypothetical protein